MFDTVLAGDTARVRLPPSFRALVWDQVNLPQIRKPGSAAGEIAVPDDGAGVRRRGLPTARSGSRDGLLKW